MNTMKNRLIIYLFSFLLIGCYPEGAEFVDELDVAYTNYDPDFNFGNVSTYSLPDRVIDITGDTFNGNQEYIDQEFSDAILNNLKDNLDAMGWTEIDEEDSPDVIILASAFSTTTLYYYDWCWWDWYYPGYCGGWNWYYPGYSPGFVSGYSTGTVLLQMVEPGGVQNNQLPVVWLCGLNGLLQGSDASIIARIGTNIDQAFTHPPFNQ
jgi:hypothetical protein